MSCDGAQLANRTRHIAQSLVSAIGDAIVWAAVSEGAAVA